MGPLLKLGGKSEAFASPPPPLKLGRPLQSGMIWSRLGHLAVGTESIYLLRVAVCVTKSSFAVSPYGVGWAFANMPSRQTRTDCQRKRDAEHEHGNRPRIYYAIHGHPFFSEVIPKERGRSAKRGHGEKHVGWCFKPLRPIFLTALGVMGSQSRQPTAGAIVIQQG